MSNEDEKRGSPEHHHAGQGAATRRIKDIAISAAVADLDRQLRAVAQTVQLAITSAFGSVFGKAEAIFLVRNAGYSVLSPMNDNGDDTYSCTALKAGAEFNVVVDENPDPPTISATPV